MPIVLEHDGEPALPDPAWPPGWSIRRLDATDVADRRAWATLCGRAFGGMFGARSYQRIADQREGFIVHGTWLAVTDGQMHGAITVKAPDREPSVGMVHMIALDPSVHGQGLGRALILEGFRRARDAGATRYEVETTLRNGAAMGILHALGFRRKRQASPWNQRPASRSMARWADRIYRRRFGGDDP